MSKASAALRRSTVRIRSLASGHTPLNLVISELSSTRQRYKDLLSSQTSCAKKLEKWSQAEDNPALQDVLHQVFELNLMWVETQREFVVALKEYKRVFESILEMEKMLDQARKNLASCEEKEKKLQKELVKAKEPAVVQEKLRLATDSKDLADAEVLGQQRETEAVKLMSVRAGLLDLSRSWETMGSNCSLLAQAQKELAKLIPDIGSSRVQDIPSYTGTRDSSRILYDTRSQLGQMNPPDYSGEVVSSYSVPASLNQSTGNYQPVSRNVTGKRRKSSSSSSGQRRMSNPEQTTLTSTNMQVLAAVDDFANDSFDSFDSDD